MHHVHPRGNHKEPLFLEDRDRLVYLALLEKTVRHYEWLCLSYCLMRNHIHVLIETPRPNLGRGMNWLQGQYGRYFARRLDLPGSVFEKPYGSTRVMDESHLWMAIRYIAQNPVEAQLCATPGDWAWSSHRGVIDGSAPEWVARGRLLEYFEGLGGVPAERYAALVG